MFSWLIFLFSAKVGNQTVAQIQIEESEVEMIWVPSDWSGPIVAAPFDDSIFN
jgi:hypothetical protein